MKTEQNSNNLNKLTTMKSKILLALFALFSLTTMAQTPVRFSVQQKKVSPTEVDVIFTGKIDAGWHVYSTGLPSGGPTSAALTTEKAEGAQPMGKLTPRGKEINVFDKVFEMKLRYFEHSVSFVQKYKITGKTYKIAGYMEYGACNDEMCMPPSSVEFSYSGNGPADAPAATENTAAKEGENEIGEVAAAPGATTDTAKTAELGGTMPGDSVQSAGTSAATASELWQPVIKELKAFSAEKDNNDKSLLGIFLMGIVGGFIALLTP